MSVRRNPDRTRDIFVLTATARGFASMVRFPETRGVWATRTGACPHSGRAIGEFQSRNLPLVSRDCPVARQRRRNADPQGAPGRSGRVDGADGLETPPSETHRRTRRLHPKPDIRSAPVRCLRSPPGIRLDLAAAFRDHGHGRQGGAQDQNELPALNARSGALPLSAEACVDVRETCRRLFIANTLGITQFCRTAGRFRSCQCSRL